MTERRIYIPDGKYPELRIHLQKKEERPEHPTRFLGTPSRRPIFPPYVPQDDPIPQGQPTGIQFFDLGTRKNVDGTYRDIMTSDAVITTITDANRYTITNQGHTTIIDWPSPFTTRNPLDTFYAGLLAGDDLTQDGICAKLPQPSQWMYVDGVFLPENIDLDSERQPLGNVPSRPYISNPNPLFGGLLSGSSTLAPTTTWRNARLPFNHDPTVDGEFYPATETAFFYRAFKPRDPSNPGNPHLHVTATLDPTAAGVFLLARKTLKIFLIPRTVAQSSGGTPQTVYLGRFLPFENFTPETVEPFSDYAVVFETVFAGYHPSAGNTQNVLHANSTIAFWDKLNTLYGTIFPGSLWDTSIKGYPAGMGISPVTTVDNNDVTQLIAIAVDGTSIFYVWYIPQSGDAVPNSQFKCRVYKP